MSPRLRRNAGRAAVALYGLALVVLLLPAGIADLDDYGTRGSADFCRPALFAAFRPDISEQCAERGRARMPYAILALVLAVPAAVVRYAPGGSDRP